MRTRDEINQSYSNVCSQLGDIIARFEASKQMLLAEIARLSTEMAELESKESEVKNEDSK